MTPAERDATLLDLVFRRGAILEALDNVNADLAAFQNRQAAAMREVLLSPETLETIKLDRALEPMREEGRKLLRGKGELEIALRMVESDICMIPAGALDGIKLKFAVFSELTARPYHNDRPTNSHMARQLAGDIAREFDEIDDHGI